MLIRTILVLSGLAIVAGLACSDGALNGEGTEDITVTKKLPTGYAIGWASTADSLFVLVAAPIPTTFGLELQTASGYKVRDTLVSEGQGDLVFGWPRESLKAGVYRIVFRSDFEADVYLQLIEEEPYVLP